jgi:hypothetical protein
MGEVDPPEERRAVLRDAVLPAAVRRSSECEATARSLLDAGFRSAAFVWAVRAAEIFFRDGLLLAIEYEASGDLDAAANAAQDVIGGGKWSRTVRTIRSAYGLNDARHDIQTEGGEDAWLYWGREGVKRRHDVVHGRDEITDDSDVEWALAFVEQLRKTFTLRAIASEQGPFANVFREIYETAYEARWGRRPEPGVASTGPNLESESNDAGSTGRP